MVEKADMFPSELALTLPSGVTLKTLADFTQSLLPTPMDGHRGFDDWWGPTSGSESIYFCPYMVGTAPS